VQTFLVPTLSQTTRKDGAPTLLVVPANQSPGHPPEYGFFTPPFVVNTDGTIFTLETSTSFDPKLPPVGGAVVTIDPLTGMAKGPGTPPVGMIPSSEGGGPVSFFGFGNLIVAGDGYAYVPYSYSNISSGPCGLIQGVQYDSPYSGTVYLNLLQIDTNGNSTPIQVGSWNVAGDCYSGTSYSVSNAYVITNADQGTLVTWQLTGGFWNSTAPTPQQNTYYIATTSGTSLTSQNTMQNQITPVLQAQDGMFFGTDLNGNMDRFDQTGNIQWSVSDSPQVATADNGVIGVSGTTYDANGNATGQLTSPNASWTGNTYQTGSVEQTLNIAPEPATPPYWSFNGGNQSANSASPLCKDDRDQLTPEYWIFGSGFIPTCQQFLSQQTWPLSPFSFQQINISDMGSTPPAPDHPNWALAPHYFLTGLANLQTLWGSAQPLGINSAYRSPKVQQRHGSPHDRHIHGDAVDIASTSQNYNDLRATALDVSNSCVEPLQNQINYCQKHPSPPCNPKAHVHVDWRRVATPPPPPAEACAKSWMQ
jgi:hypothetical protein